jgi:APA family basic amino acid/polyamine antiporter
VLAAWASLLVVIGAILTTTRLPELSLFGATWDLNPPVGKTLFDVLTDFAVFGAVLFEALAVASIYVLRRTRPHAVRPYRCLGYPWTPLICIIGYAGILASYAAPQKQMEALTGIGFTLVGAAVYVVFLRRGQRGITADQ